jgi:D-serine deaminase-like pyridoxal phosphate-dependent protein
VPVTETGFTEKGSNTVSSSYLDLATPALLIDADQFESNLRKMQDAVDAAGKTLRPHAKAHKSVEIALRQMDAGAVGVCVATLPEMHWMHAARIPLLLTTPIADTAKTGSVARLVAAGGDIRVVVDHEVQARLYSESAAAAGIRIPVLMDLDIGDHRTGIPCDERAIRLALAIEQDKHLQFAGLQAYSVSGSHTGGFEQRRAHSVQALAGAITIQKELIGQGLDAVTLTGGSTGTWNIDVEIPEFTELQAGSYPLMDVAYRAIVGDDFPAAMSILATVISASHPDRVTVDAGFKAFATDRPFGPEPIGIRGVRWEWAGDEHGFLHLENPSQPLRIGDKIRFLAPHTDPTANLYTRAYILRGDRVEAVWPLKGLAKPPIP